MNANKFLNSSYLKENPLCGIDTYKDELNLATGACTRKIKKLVFDGTEEWTYITNGKHWAQITGYQKSGKICLCTHYIAVENGSGSGMVTNGQIGFYNSDANRLIFCDTSYTTTDAWKSYLAQQYANGTPVTVWYVLATPTTETITVPSGLSGTEEGHLIQDGTPTPTNPIYPTANTVEKWFDINHYIHNTSTDTLTTLPADIYANDTTATLGLKGDMSQTGTPTPTTPIQPSECGERTGNLLNPTLIMTNKAFNTAGVIVDYEGYACSGYVPVEPSTTYVRNCNGVAVGNVVSYFTNNKTLINLAEPGTGVPFTTPSNCAFVGFNFNMENYDMNSYALNTTPNIPFEPYGYKIPILNNSQTTNVYLSEVQTTRKIRELVLTGEEDWQLQSINSYGIANFWVFGYLTGINSDRSALCTHFYQTTASIANVTEPCFSISTTSASLYLRIQSTTASDATEFKSWLAQQYAAGTPVCVWYVLAEPTTGIVNEPIRKIGDYADEVSGITIPTIAGANTIDVDTTLKPLEVTVNYKGWHSVMNGHESESGQWD